MKQISRLKQTFGIAAVSLALIGANTATAANMTAGYVVGGMSPAFVDHAAAGGGDSGQTAGGILGFAVQMTNLWTPGSTIRITGVALPLRTVTSAGTFNFLFYDLNAGANPNAYDGSATETLLGVGQGELLVAASASAYSVVFDTPLVFTPTSSGIAVVITNSGLNMQVKINVAAGAPNAVRVNRTTGAVIGGANPNMRFTLGGSVVVPPAVGSFVWQGNVSSDWDGATTNWNRHLGGYVFAADKYTDNGSFGPQVIFDDSLVTPFRTNINLTTGTPLRPSSLIFANGAYRYDFSGPGKITGATALTNSGFGVVTLNTANDFTGGSVLAGGRVRLGHANGLGVGNISFASGGLSSLGGTPVTITNNLLITTTAILGNTTDNGVLTVSSTVNLNGGAPGIDVQSDVNVTGLITNGGIGVKSGPGTLTLNGVVSESAGSWAIQNGVLKVDGISLIRPTSGIRVGATAANGVARLVITNGATVTINNANVVQLGVQGQSSLTSSNYLDLSGTLQYGAGFSGVVNLGNASIYDELNLHPGSLLRVGGVTYSAAAGSLTGNTTIVNVNGATIAASASSANYMSNHTAVNIQAGGVTFDTETNSITIAQALLDGSGGGGLTKIGTGTLTLTSTSHTYTGATVVNDGTLEVALPFTSSALRVANGKTVSFIVNNSSGTANLSVTNSTINFNFGNAGVLPPTIVTSASVNASGVNVVNISGVGLPLGPITLIQHGGKIGGGTFVLGSLPVGVVATLNDGPTAVVLNVTSSVKALTWTASVDNEWATNGLLNWNFGADAYQEYPSGFGDQVTFGDDAGISYSVNLTNNVKPAAVIVNIPTASVILSGSGQIAGATGLTKSGAGILTIANTNAYTGVTTVTAGTLVPTTPGALGSTAGGTSVSGTGTVQIGDGLSTGVTITGETISISGAGVGGVLGALRGAADVGANIWAGPIIVAANGARIGTEDNGSLTVAGNITDNGNNYVLLYRPGAGGTLNITSSGHSYGITRTFGGAVRLGINNALSTNLLEVGSGTIDLNGFNQTIGGLADSSGPGTILNNGGGASTLTINTGTNDFSSAALIQDGAAAINLIKTGNTRQLLTGAHSYTGTTAVNGGELRINNTLASSAVTVASGGTLRGVGGTIAGPISVLSGGTFAAGGFDLGTLTNNNTLTFNAGSFCLAHLRGNTTNSDLAVVTTVAYAGTLQVTNISATPIQVGQVYTLFSAGSFSGNFINAPSVAIQGGGTGSFNPSTGQLTILTGPSAPTLNVVNNGTSLDFSWTGSFKLQAQTNSINVGVSNNWGDYPGGSSSPVNVPVDAAQATVFFRLINQ